MRFLYEYAHYAGCFALVFIGLYIVLVKHNLIKVIIGIGLIDTGVNLFLVTTGYIRAGTAPVFSRLAEKPEQMVDPVPQALVLTAIVIGVSVLALALSLAIRLYGRYGTLDLRKIKELKW
ncbi:MAG: cation:proton antiporter [Planctomycetes bacterium DG_58]|nr:MAG: cation:proton antiporter [Planctomycetes bacterium DG_58]KPL03398.1 MAG: cation:proton antiporter [Planctomycetes bacterium SM23_65]